MEGGVGVAGKGGGIVPVEKDGEAQGGIQQEAGVLAALAPGLAGKAAHLKHRQGPVVLLGALGVADLAEGEGVFHPLAAAVLPPVEDGDRQGPLGQNLAGHHLHVGGFWHRLAPEKGLDGRLALGQVQLLAHLEGAGTLAQQAGGPQLLLTQLHPGAGGAAHRLLLPGVPYPDGQGDRPSDVQPPGADAAAVHIVAPGPHQDGGVAGLSPQLADPGEGNLVFAPAKAPLLGTVIDRDDPLPLHRQAAALHLGGEDGGLQGAFQDTGGVGAVVRQHHVALQGLLHGGVQQGLVGEQGLAAQIQFHRVSLAFTHSLPPSYAGSPPV